jgi:hypothetical protein
VNVFIVWRTRLCSWSCGMAGKIPPSRLALHARQSSSAPPSLLSATPVLAGPTGGPRSSVWLAPAPTLFTESSVTCANRCGVCASVFKREKTTNMSRLAAHPPKNRWCCEPAVCVCGATVRCVGESPTAMKGIDTCAVTLIGHPSVRTEEATTAGGTVL